ncbi:MAG: hypothetical protein SVY53_02160 [Chloroflexota bacterium]|nr:hypothetical protein [Chloroflexota bacterium]
MRRMLLPILAMFLAIGMALPLAVPTEAAERPTEANPWCWVLVAGQNIDVGYVNVWDDGDNLYVKYLITSPGWEIQETHLAVADGSKIGGVPEAIPQTKKGNPKIGKFPYHKAFETGITEYTYVIPLSDYAWPESSSDPDACIYIAAHAVVINGCDNDETAWGWGEPCTGGEFPGRSWARYLKYYPDYS